LLLGTSAEDIERLIAECKARRDLGIAVEYLDELQLKWDFSIHRAAALLFGACGADRSGAVYERID